MTYKEKLREEHGTLFWSGCPHDHGYEERPCFYTHCASMTCEECWNREMKEKENRNMKYKVGDTVYMKGTVIEIDERDELLETLVDFEMNGKEWTNPRGLSPYLPSDKTYEDGLQDAWELAKKAYNYTCNELEEIFGVKYGFHDFISKFTYQEALAKLKAYEESQKIKVGDVVESNINQKKYLVLEEIHDGEWDFWALDIEQMEVTQIADSHYYFKKTGKHIDIAGLLEQIKGE